MYAILFLLRCTLVTASRLEPILISRFLINLRQADTPEDSMHASHLSRFSTPNFRVPTLQSFVGNMGESLEHGTGHDEDKDAAVDILVPLTSTNGDASRAGPTTTEQCDGNGCNEVCGTTSNLRTTFSFVCRHNFETRGLYRPVIAIL